MTDVTHGVRYYCEPTTRRYTYGEEDVRVSVADIGGGPTDSPDERLEHGKTDNGIRWMIRKKEAELIIEIPEKDCVDSLLNTVKAATSDTAIRITTEATGSATTSMSLPPGWRFVSEDLRISRKRRTISIALAHDANAWSAAAAEQEVHMKKPHKPTQAAPSAAAVNYEKLVNQLQNPTEAASSAAAADNVKDVSKIQSSTKAAATAAAVEHMKTENKPGQESEGAVPTAATVPGHRHEVPRWNLMEPLDDDSGTSLCLSEEVFSRTRPQYIDHTQRAPSVPDQGRPSREGQHPPRMRTCRRGSQNGSGKTECQQCTNAWPSTKSQPQPLVGNPMVYSGSESVRKETSAEYDIIVPNETDWMPSITPGRTAEWIEDIAYELAYICNGDRRVLRWILDLKSDNPNRPSTELPNHSKWRSLDLFLAKETKRMVNRLGNQYPTIQCNMALLRKTAIRDERVIGGREMLMCILNTVGKYDEKKGIKDLANIKAPNAKTLGEFYATWQTILIDIDEDTRTTELKAILEQKLDESKLFEYELRALDVWDISDEEMYSKYNDIIEKRIKRETQKTAYRTSEDKTTRTKKEETSETETKVNVPTQPKTSEETIANSRPEDPIMRFLSKGKGKGKHANPYVLRTQSSGPERTSPYEQDPMLMETCQKLGACYKFANGNCMKEDCKYNHIPRDELTTKDKSATHGVFGYAKCQ